VFIERLITSTQVQAPRRARSRLFEAKLIPTPGTASADARPIALDGAKLVPAAAPRPPAPESATRTPAGETGERRIEPLAPLAPPSAPQLPSGPTLDDLLRGTFKSTAMQPPSAEAPPVHPSKRDPA
jgi:hypothetical protein